jgi:hypothetical protein
MSIKNPKGQKPGASLPSQQTLRQDPYARLLSPKTTIRIEAAVTLVQDIEKQHKKDEEAAKCSDSTVKTTPLGLTLHLDYVLNRLIAGLESTDRYATIGFSTALVMVLDNFSAEIPTATFQSLVLTRLQTATYSALSNKEKESFDLGCLFMTQVLERTKRLGEIATELVERLLLGIARLARKHAQMADLCIQAVVALSESSYKSSSRHYNVILSTLTSFIPKGNKKAENDDIEQEKDDDGDGDDQVHQNQKNNTHVPPQLSQWNATTISAALALRRLNQSEVYSTQFPGFFEQDSTWDTIFALLVPTLPLYPAIPSVWVDLLFDSLTIPGQFESFWNKVIVTNLATEFGYHKKGLAMGIINSFLTRIIQLVQLDPENNTFSNTTLHLIITTMFNVPELVKVMITHSRAEETPLYLQSVTLLGTLESFGTLFKSTIPTMLSIFSDPIKGGSRNFDAKSNTKFLASITALLDKNDLISYIEQTIQNFHNSKQLILEDIRHVAELTKKRQDEVNAVNDKDVDDNDNEVDNTLVNKDSKIEDIDAFIATPAVQSALSQGISALHSWTIDHVYHLCELLFKLQRNAQHKLNIQLKEQRKNQPIEPINAKKSKKKTVSQPQDEEKNEFKIDSEELENCLQNCIKFLYTHAFYKAIDSTAVAAAAAPTTKKGSKTDNVEVVIQKVNHHCQDLSKQRFISLYTTLLLADSHYRPHGPTSLAFGHNESRWGLFVTKMDTDLRNIHKCTLASPQSAALTQGTQDAEHIITIFGEFIENLKTKYNKDVQNQINREYLDLATMLRYFVVTISSLLYSDSSVLAPLLSDLKMIAYQIQKEYVSKSGRGTKVVEIELSKEELQMLKEQEKEQNGPQWVDVALDILLSVLGLGHSVTKHVVVKSFRVLIPHLTMSSITLLIDPIATAIEEEANQDEMGDDEPELSKSSKMGDDDGDSDFVDFSDDDKDDFSDMSDADEELGDVIQKFTQSGASLDSDDETKNENGGDDDDDNDDEEEEESEEEIDAGITADILLDNNNSYITQEQEDAIAGIVKLQKDHHRQQKNKLNAVMLMKLRILDLVEILLEDAFATNTWLTLILPMIVLIKNTRNAALTPLQTKAISLFRKLLCNIADVNTRLGDVRREMKLDEKSPFFSYINITGENISMETMIEPQDITHGDNLQAIIDAIVESIQSSPQAQEAGKKNPQNDTSMDRTTMAGYALSTLASLYLVAPAGPAEYIKATGGVPPAAPAARKSTKAKKSPSTSLPADEIQKSIYTSRIEYFTPILAKLIQKQYFKTTKEFFSPKFLSLIFDSQIVSSAFPWSTTTITEADATTTTTNILQLLLKAMDVAWTPFLRKSAGDVVGVALRNGKFTRAASLDLGSLYQSVGAYYNNVKGLLETATTAVGDANNAKQLLQQKQQKDQKEQKGNGVKVEDVKALNKPVNSHKQPQKKKKVNPQDTQALKAKRVALQAINDKTKAFVLVLEKEIGVKQTMIVKTGTLPPKLPTPKKPVVETPKKRAGKKSAAVEEDKIDAAVTAAKKTTNAAKSTMMGDDDDDDDDDKNKAHSDDDFGEVELPASKSRTRATKKTEVVEEIKPTAKKTTKKAAAVEEEEEAPVAEAPTPKKRTRAAMKVDDDAPVVAVVAPSTPRRSNRLVK